MKKILIHTIVFSPDSVSTAYIYNDIALRFKSRGYAVTVLTTTPHYNVVKEQLDSQQLVRRKVGIYYESDFHGIKVMHIPLRKFKSTPLRLAGFIYWHFMAFILGLFEKDIDIILSPSPPLTIGVINILLGRIKKSKVIYNVQEIYPDLLIKEGNLKSKFIISALRRMEKFVYDKSDFVTTIDKVFYDTIVERFKSRSKLKIIPNFVDTTIYTPLSLTSIRKDPAFFPSTTSLKLMYAGNIGLAQDWRILIRIATLLREDNIDFFVIGEGAMKNYLDAEIKSNNLSKVHLFTYQAREMMPSLIAYADLHFIFMAPHTDSLGFPSKVYTIMACAKPMIVCSGYNTPIINFLRNLDCAFLVDEIDECARAQKLVQILRSVNNLQLRKMGYKGMENILSFYSKDAVTDKYVELAELLS